VTREEIQVIISNNLADDKTLDESAIESQKEIYCKIAKSLTWEGCDINLVEICMVVICAKCELSFFNGLIGVAEPGQTRIAAMANGVLPRFIPAFRKYAEVVNFILCNFDNLNWNTIPFRPTKDEIKKMKEYLEQKLDDWESEFRSSASITISPRNLISMNSGLDFSCRLFMGDEAFAEFVKQTAFANTVIEQTCVFLGLGTPPEVM